MYTEGKEGGRKKWVWSINDFVVFVVQYLLLNTVQYVSIVLVLVGVLSIDRFGEFQERTKSIDRWY